METRHMQQLLAIRTHGSMAKAARALGMSQPSLSAAIARLEDELKVTLFDRSARGSSLTPIGEMIADRAGKVLLETAHIVRDAALTAGGDIGALRLGVGTALRDNFLGPFVHAITDAYPSLSLDLLVLDRDRLIPMLKARELDLVICSYGDDLVGDQLIASEVMTAAAVAVAAPGHILASESPVSVARFAEFPSAGTIHTLYSNAAVLDVRGPSDLLRYQSNDYHPMLQLALSGRATLVAPDFVVQPYLSNGSLRRIALDWEFKVSFAAVATRATSYSPIVSRVTRIAAELGRSLG